VGLAHTIVTHRAEHTPRGLAQVGVPSAALCHAPNRLGRWCSNPELAPLGSAPRRTMPLWTWFCSSDHVLPAARIRAADVGIMDADGHPNTMSIQRVPIPAR